MASIVEDSGDILRCVRAGRTRILYFFRRSLYFVCVCPAQGPAAAESEAAIVAQLEFLYCQIIFILTSKVLLDGCFFKFYFVYLILFGGLLP